jgi:hypothetical protein
MSISKLDGSTTKKRIYATAPARIGRKSTSAVCAVLKSASTITLRAHTASGMRKRVHGAKITTAV